MIRMEELRKKAEKGLKMEIWGGIGILILPVGIALLYAGSRMREKANSELDELYREVYVHEPLAARFENVSFEQLEGFSEEKVGDFRICREGNEFDSEAYGKGSYGDVQVEVSDVTISDYDRVATRNNLKTIFKGRMLQLEFPEEIASSETIYSKTFTAGIPDGEKEEQKEMNTMGAEYGELFDLYVSDPGETKERISLSLLDRLKSVSTRHRGVAMRVYGNKLILAMDDGGGDAFYRKKAKEVSLEKELMKVHEDLEDVKAMISLIENRTRKK